MLFDVPVNRISTARRTVRVEADNLEEAEKKALEAAREENFSGCCVDYDFEAAGSPVEVADPSVPVHLMGVAPEESPCEKCAFCDKPMPEDIEQVADEGWHPDYWEGEQHCDGPVCPECLERYCKLDESGEFVLKELKGEFVSVWDGGREFRSPCTVNMRTRTVRVLETHETDESVEQLDREYVVLDGKEYEAANIGERCAYTVVQQKTMFFYQ
jgi:hypothetical protein